MSISSKLKSLDKLISKGKIIEAFETHFHDDVVTFSSDTDKTVSKKEKLSLLKDFFKNISSIDEVKFHDHIVRKGFSYSKFTFIFTNKQHERLKWHEIIRRKWKGDQVIEEFYYHEKFSKLKERLESKKRTKPTVKKKTTQKESGGLITKELKAKQSKGTASTEGKSSTKASKPAATKKTVPAKKVTKKTTTQSKPNVVKKAVTPKVPTNRKTTASKTTIAKKLVLTAKPPVTKKVTTTTAKPTSTRKPRSRKAPDLTIVEGIGPKIKELLGQGGILTFADLAKADVSNMRSILLEKGGTRYNVHDPATWPEQAALARDGKWDELTKLKDELKGGKR